MSKIEKINKEIAKIQEETNAKIKALEEQRDKIIREQNPSFTNPYIKYKEDECDYVGKIIDATYHFNGEIDYYTAKVLGYNGFLYYHPEYVLNPRSLVRSDFKFISKEEFEDEVKMFTAQFYED